jgi:ABC-type nitrate/sulfonate/bicarbonate transport system substrate-binding protein
MINPHADSSPRLGMTNEHDRGVPWFVMLSAAKHQPAPRPRRPSIALLPLTLLLAACGASNAATSAPAAPASKPAAPASAAPASASAVASASAAASGQAFTFNFGTSTATQASTLPGLTAQQQGFDSKNGVKINIVNAEGGSRGLQVVLGGQLQAMEVGLAPVVIANAQGANFRLITSTTNSIPYVVYGAKGVTVDNLAQKLKGSKIGISTFGSESDVSSSLFLEKFGLVRDRDVAVVQIGGGTARLSALIGGAVGASPLTAVDQLKAKSEGLQPLYDLTKDSKWVFDGVVVDKGWADSHQDTVTSFIKAWMEGNYYSRSHVDAMRKLLGQQNKTDDSQLIDAAQQEFSVGPVDLRPGDDGIREVLKQVPALNNLQLKSQSPADYVDLSVLDKLKASGFSDQLRAQYKV